MLGQCRSVAPCTGEDGRVTRELLEELEGKHGAVERNESCQEGQQEEPSLPCCRGQWWKSSRDGCRDILRSVSRGNPGAYHCSALPSGVLRKPSSPSCAGAANTPTASGVQCGLSHEPVLTCGLPALLQPGSLSAATASPLSCAAAARQPIWLRVSPS